MDEERRKTGFHREGISPSSKSLAEKSADICPHFALRIAPLCGVKSASRFHEKRTLQCEKSVARPAQLQARHFLCAIDGIPAMRKSGLHCTVRLFSPSGMNASRPSYHQGQPSEPTRGLTSISPTIRFEPAQLRKSSVQTPESSPSFHRSRQARRIPFAPSKGCQRNPRANWRASLQRQGSDPHKRESPAYRLPNQAPSFHRSRQARHIPFAPSEAIIAYLAHKLAGVSPMKRLISA